MPRHETQRLRSATLPYQQGQYNEPEDKNTPTLYHNNYSQTRLRDENNIGVILLMALSYNDNAISKEAAMNRFQLAKLIDWAGTLESRKRLQKIVYLLKAAGCKLDVEYTLHHYGPYSQDLARLTDQMVQAELLGESSFDNPSVGQSYSYQLTSDARKQLQALERSGKTLKGKADLEKFESLAKKLLEQPNLRMLEYAATIAYFRDHGKPRGEALEEASRFKNQNPTSRIMCEADEFAHHILEDFTHGHESLS